MSSGEPQRCPFCAEPLETKDGLLYCTSQKIFIGAPKTTEESAVPLSREMAPKEKERESKKETTSSASKTILAVFTLVALVASVVLYLNRQRAVPATEERSRDLARPGAQAPAAEPSRTAPAGSLETQPQSDPFAVPEPFSGVSWNPPKYTIAKIMMVDNNFRLDPSSGRIYSWLRADLEGDMRTQKLTGINGYDEVLALSAAFEEYYSETLGGLGWTKSLVWSGQRFDFTGMHKPDAKVQFYGKSEGERLRFVMLEQHITNPAACPCDIELILFESYRYTLDDLFPG